MCGIAFLWNVAQDDTIGDSVNGALRHLVDSISSESISREGSGVENMSLLSLNHEVNSATGSLNEWGFVAECTSDWHVLEGIGWSLDDNLWAWPQSVEGCLVWDVVPVTINYEVNLWLSMRLDYEAFIGGAYHIGPMWVVAEIISSGVSSKHISCELNTVEWFSGSGLFVSSQFATKTFITLGVVVSAISLTYITWLLVSAWHQLSSQDSPLHWVALVLRCPVWVEANIVGTHVVHFQSSSPFNTGNVLSWSITGTTLSLLAPKTVFAVNIWVLRGLMWIEAGTFSLSARLRCTARPWRSTEFGDGSFRWWIDVGVILEFLLLNDPSPSSVGLSLGEVGLTDLGVDLSKILFGQSFVVLAGNSALDGSSVGGIK